MKKNDLLEEITSKKMPTHIAFILDGMVGGLKIKAYQELLAIIREPILYKRL